MKDYRVIRRACVDCGEEFTISKEFQEMADENDIKLPKRCKSCREKRKNFTKEITCIDCGEVFTMSGNEVKFYEERGLHEPKRCPECRKKKRNNNNG